MRLREIGEQKLLARILPKLRTDRRVLAAAGDDCAIVRFPGAKDYLLLKTDCVVEGVHFSALAPAAGIGWKAMMRTLSDFAAMAGVPQFALVALIVPGRKKVEWVRRVYQGLNRAAARFDVAIVGGETSDTNGPTTIVVSAAGFVERERVVLRSGGQPGDALFVTGTLGGSVPKRHLRFVPRIAEARWLTAHLKIKAMIDLSDGLGTDLPRLARASQAGFEIDYAALPVRRGCTVHQAFSEGEDYELLFAISPGEEEHLQKEWGKKFSKIRLTRIGQLTKPAAGDDKLPHGYVHYAGSG